MLCEYCGNRQAVTEIHGEDSSVGYSETMQVCRRCALVLSGKAEREEPCKTA